MGTRSRLAVCVLALLAVAGACKKKDSSSSSGGGAVAPLSGTWAGTRTFTHSNATCGSVATPSQPITFTLTQTGTAVTGTFVFQNSGTTNPVSGTVTGTTVTMNVPRVCADGTGTVVYACTLSGSTMNCTMSGQNCLGCTASTPNILLANVTSGGAAVTKQ